MCHSFSGVLYEFVKSRRGHSGARSRTRSQLYLMLARGMGCRTMWWSLEIKTSPGGGQRQVSTVT